MKLKTENPNCFVYEAGELKIELLGGVRVDTLDRMRVTMKVTVVNRKHKDYLNNEELAGLSVRHNLDLYNDTQVEKFVRRVAERLKVGSIAITKAISDGLYRQLYLPQRHPAADSAGRGKDTAEGQQLCV